MDQKNRRKEVIEAFGDSKPEDADIRAEERVKITDPEAIDTMRSIAESRANLRKYIEENVEPLVRQLNKHQMRAQGVQSDERVLALDFWDRLHEIGVIDQTDDQVWQFELEDGKEQEDEKDPDVWIKKSSRDKGKEETPDFVRYLMKALGMEDLLE